MPEKGGGAGFAATKYGTMRGTNTSVDDTLFGGGMGMLLLAEPIAAAFDDVERKLWKKTAYYLYVAAGKNIDPTACT